MFGLPLFGCFIAVGGCAYLYANDSLKRFSSLKH